jgi:acetyltransferase-like isoleucine patch superfamily enzyme
MRVTLLALVGSTAAIGTLAGRAVRNPFGAAAFVMSRIRGELYRILLPLMGRRFKAGPGLQVRGRLVVRGPGRVEFGANVQIYERVTPWTHDPDAVIRIGDRTTLAGARFGCASSITIGQDCIIADVRLMDTDFHSVRPNRRELGAAVRVAPIVVEDNVWLAAAAAVLPGSTIGQNSVASFGAVCSGRYPPNVVIVGNPGRVAGSVLPKERKEETVSAEPA